LNEVALSNIGYAQIVIKIIKQFSYDLNGDLVEKLQRIKFFPINNNIVDSVHVDNYNKISDDFKVYLESNLSERELFNFFRKLNINFL